MRICSLSLFDLRIYLFSLEGWLGGLCLVARKRGPGPGRAGRRGLGRAGGREGWREGGVG